MLITYPRDDGPMVMDQTQRGNTTVRRAVNPYRLLSVSVDDGQVANNGSDTETVTIRLKNGLEVANGEAIEDATILDMDEDVVVAVNGIETTKTLESGTLQFEITSTKPSGSVIDVETRGVVGVTNNDDSAIIEVVSQ